MLPIFLAIVKSLFQYSCYFHKLKPLFKERAYHNYLAFIQAVVT